jgi:hypothetical protein
MIIKHYHEVLPPQKGPPPTSYQTKVFDERAGIGPPAVLDFGKAEQEEFVTYDRFGRKKKF